MSYLPFQSLYNKFPVIPVETEEHITSGASEIIRALEKSDGIIVFETYPGIDLSFLRDDIINKLNPKEIINIEHYAKPESEIDLMLEKNITNDRVFGLYAHHTIHDFYNHYTLLELYDMLSHKKGLKVIYGTGASLIKGDLLIHVSLTRWEIQLRYRKGTSNLFKHNPSEDILRKYKRGYFVDWRVADRIKYEITDHLDYIIDYNDLSNPKMISRSLYETALDQIVLRPFRMVPYFDPGVWGGQWMKEVCNLDLSEKNFAWAFDGVPEENSIRLGISNCFFEIPAQDVVDFRTKALLGDRVHGRFGRQFPIRFDFLDTMEGGNLSLQVHPLTEYIREKFGMSYTQDESYYILDTKDDGVVYLGFKEDLVIEDFKRDLIEASKGNMDFPAEKYINIWPSKKHDHFLIPAGTIHCSGKNTMVLEISACVYIFTFKLWDWGRNGLDGKPRPVHLEHGFKNLQYDRRTDMVKHELINAITKVSDVEEVTGLHEREFLETRRFTFQDSVIIPTKGSVNMANLVSGKKMTIESVDGSFEPYEIHYVETFIVPETIKAYKVVCHDVECIMMVAHVR
jgi:mannose-6-phosphate isomerase class I